MTQKGNVGVKRFNRNWQDGNPYVKSKNGVWTRPNSIFVKQNGEWVNTTKTESFYDNVIKYSAIFDAVDNTYLEDVAPEANRVPIAKWVLSVWLKRSAYLDVRQFVYGWIWSGTNSAWIEFDTSSKINIANYYSRILMLKITQFKTITKAVHFGGLTVILQNELVHMIKLIMILLAIWQTFILSMMILQMLVNSADLEMVYGYRKDILVVTVFGGII
jgi:hypothetical protein